MARHCLPWGRRVAKARRFEPGSRFSKRASTCDCPPLHHSSSGRRRRELRRTSKQSRPPGLTQSRRPSRLSRSPKRPHSAQRKVPRPSSKDRQALPSRWRRGRPPRDAVGLDSFRADDELGGTFEEPVAEEPLIEEALIEEARVEEALAAEPEVDRAIEGEAVAAADEIESPSQPLESSMASKES